VVDCTNKWSESDIPGFTLQSAICVDDLIFMEGQWGVGDESSTSMIGIFDPSINDFPWRITFLHPGAFTYDGTHLWIARTTDNTLHALDPKSPSKVTRFPLAINPKKLIYDGARLWILDAAGNKVQYLLIRQ
ncbi:MAG TPA: hypothetical protein VII92_04020, partial [Anaerolineae bacterium]